VVLVEDHADGHAALDRRGERRAEGGTGRGVEPQVVDRDLQRLLRAVDESGDALGDGQVGLRAVGQEEQVQRRWGGGD
jgi:hypothetical protein